MRQLVTLLFLAVMTAAGAELTIAEPVFRPAEDAPGMSPAIYPSGVPVYLTFRAKGFAAAGEEKVVHLAFRATAFDPSKRPLAEPYSKEMKVELSPEDKDWSPILRYEVQIPPVPEPGVYTVEIVLEDRIAKTAAKAAPTFRVDAQPVPDLSALGVRNLRFMHSENDVTGYATGAAAYRPGAALWARFDISGYKFGPKNKYAIRYGIALKDPEGKVLFEEPKAAAEDGESFYPKLFVSGGFSVNLGKNLKPGEYSLVVTVTDELAGVSAESVHTFRVEA